MIFLLAAVIVVSTGAHLWIEKLLVGQLQAVRQEANTERQSLLAQIQANSQNQPYYPTLGPLPEAPPEEKWLTDPSGLITFPDYEDDILEEVADR